MSDLSKLRRLGRTMQAILAIGAVPIPLGAMWFLAELLRDPLGFEPLLRQVVNIPGPLTFTPQASVLVVVLVTVQIAFLVAALYCVWRMFGVFAGEEPLVAEAAVWMRRASLAFVIMAVGGVIARALLVVVLTMGNPPGQQAVSIAVGSGELLTLLIALIMYMMGRVMSLAAEVRADQRGFV